MACARSVLSLAWFLIWLTVCCASHFRGGTISWKPTNNTYEAEFSYRLGWRYGNGHGCTELLVNQYVSRSSSTWQCTSGCSSVVTISNSGYICLAASQSEQWELGEFTFKYTFDSAGPFTITYSGGAWISLNYGSGGGSWSIETIVDFGLRSDTQASNNSPTLAGKPLYTLKFGCTHTIKIPVLDDDGDKLRCRWAVGTECASVCNAIPYTTLNEESCSLTVTANHTIGGMYAVAIMVEDYPRTNVEIGGKTYMTTDAMSKSPFQFLVYTPTTASQGCTDKPVFVDPTPPESDVITIYQGETLSVEFYATSPGTSIQSFLLIGPPGLQQSPISNLSTRPDVYTVTVTWTPTLTTGLKTICSEATDAFSITSDLYCLTIFVSEIDPCESSPCTHNGTCYFDMYTSETQCRCRAGYIGKYCETFIDHCASHPCENGAECVYNDTTGYRCECKNGWSGKHCAYRHENKTFILNSFMHADYMHYSKCQCYFGHGKQELCYTYNKVRGALFGFLGAFLGLLTSVLFYVLNECLFASRSLGVNSGDIEDIDKAVNVNTRVETEKSCEHNVTSLPDNDNDILPEIEYNIDLDSENNAVEINEESTVHLEENNDTELNPDIVKKIEEAQSENGKKSRKKHLKKKRKLPGAPKHQECMACEIKYNKVSPPRYWESYQKQIK